MPRRVVPGRFSLRGALPGGMTTSALRQYSRERYEGPTALQHRQFQTCRREIVAPLEFLESHNPVPRQLCSSEEARDVLHLGHAGNESDDTREDLNLHFGHEKRDIRHLRSEKHGILVLSRQFLPPISSPSGTYQTYL